MEQPLIRSYLDDIRGATRADEVVFWAAAAGPTDLEVAAWSARGDRKPDMSLAGNRIALAQWAVQERAIQTDAEEPVRFAVAPLIGSFEALGAVSIAAADGFGMPKQEIRESLERYARHLSALHELLVTRDQYSRSNKQTTALLNAAQRFSLQRSLSPLSESIAHAAFEMTGARAVVLVRWHVGTEIGEAVYATSEARVETGAAVAADSHVGRSCVGDIPVILEDARPLKRHGALYSEAEAVKELGSVAIVPLKSADKQIVGAIVIEGTEPRDVRSEDAKNLRLLGALAEAGLETVWQIEEITRRATTDPLTGLYNRGYFENILRLVVTETERFGGASSLLMIDLDNFKQVNDNYGHPAGDTVLRAVAEVLSGRKRAVDSCFRYGGEELALLLPRTEIDGAAELAERLREAVASKRIEWQGTVIPITISCGVAAYPTSADSAEGLLAAADDALYAAKAAGRNCVRVAGRHPARNTPPQEAAAPGQDQERQELRRFIAHESAAQARAVCPLRASYRCCADGP
jgi:diguanylate cyclase (GGDEF)-like protein